MEGLNEIMKEMEIIAEQIQHFKGDLLYDLDDFPVAVSITNEEGDIESVNKPFCKIFGYQEEELLGKSFTILLPEEKRKYYAEMHERFMDNPVNMGGRYAMQHKDGHMLDIVATAKLLFIDGKKKRMTLSFALEPGQDLETQKQQQLISLDQFIGHLNRKLKESHLKIESQETAAGIIRHNLKNKLNNMIALSRMVKDQSMSKQEHDHLLDMVIETGEQALKEINAQKDIGQMEMGIHKLKLEDFDLLELLNDIHQRLEVQFKSKDLKWLIQTDNPKNKDGRYLPYLIHADRLFMDMMFSNLIQNAVEASPEHETILININTTMAVEINIHNWGTVPEEIQDNFFEKYVTYGKRNGTGLGTYIAKMVAEAHQGMISMQSDEKEGTYLVVVLPLHRIMKDAA
jgi:PAS domain S-box-containing protein